MERRDRYARMSAPDALRTIAKSMVSRPKSLDSEINWLAKLGEVREEFLIPDYPKILAENTDTWANEISAGPFWTRTKRSLTQWRTEYKSLIGADLLPRPDLPDFQGKTEGGIRDKLTRLCRTHQDNLSQVVAEKGPPIPRLNDLVRTRMACRYIDGVEFLAKKLTEIAAQTNCSVELSREGRIEGYFAQHITLGQSVIFRLAGHEQMATINCEIQLASELATRVWDASHPLYEDARTRSTSPEEWQWKPTDPHFIANQLGHMIHLADGLLVQLRDTQNPRKK